MPAFEEGKSQEYGAAPAARRKILPGFGPAPAWVFCVPHTEAR
jgi:hypothetical protein